MVTKTAFAPFDHNMALVRRFDKLKSNEPFYDTLGGKA